MASDQITIPDFDYEETEDGRMRVPVTVKNGADTSQSVTLTVKVRAGENHNEKSTDLTVPANDSTETETIFDVTVEKFESDGSIDFDWDAQPE